jgi:hypothetical protein
MYTVGAFTTYDYLCFCLLRRRRRRFESHGDLCVKQRAGGDGVGGIGALLENRLECFGIAADLVVAVLDGFQMGDNGLRQHRLELAPGHVPNLGQNVFLGAFRGLDGRIDIQEVGRLRPVGVVPLDARQGIRLAPLDLVADRLGIVQDVDPRSVHRVTLGHLGGPVRQTHDAGALLENYRIGFDKYRPGWDASCLASFLVLVALAKQVVEPADDIPGQFQVLSLVLPDGDLSGLVQHDIGGHENGIRKQTDADGFSLFLGFFLVLDHPFQPIHRRDTVEQPGELRMGRDVGLNENLGLCRIDS